MAVSLSGKQAFRHEAFFYAGEEEFLAGIVPFVRDAVAADMPVLVAVDSAKIQALEAELNGQSEAVQFADMEQIGQNPACIIPAWQEFLAEHASDGLPVRGVGEPIWAGRSEAELVECHQHESLLNLAFSASPAFWLVCPYDTDALTNDVIEEAQHTHPFISDGNASRASEGYLRPGVAPGPFDGELPPPSGEPQEFAFTSPVHLSAVRAFVADHGRAAGLDVERTADLALAVSELATNGLLHGGGGGKVRVWPEEETLLCEVTDRGRRLHRRLQGRERPAQDQTFGRGLWLVNHLCDLVQIRSHPTGNVVRLHMKVG